MPVLIAILTAIAGALWFWARRNPREAIDTAADVVSTVRNAPRRIAFRRQTNAHPVEGIDDPRIAICALGQAFLELDDLPTKEQRGNLNIALRKTLNASAEEAEEMEVLGRWLITQCETPTAAVSRLARRLQKLDGGSVWETLKDVLSAVAGDELSAKQHTAIEDMRHALRIPDARA